MIATSKHANFRSSFSFFDTKISAPNCENEKKACCGDDAADLLDEHPRSAPRAAYLAPEMHRSPFFFFPFFLFSKDGAEHSIRLICGEDPDDGPLLCPPLSFSPADFLDQNRIVGR